MKNIPGLLLCLVLLGCACNAQQTYLQTSEYRIPPGGISWPEAGKIIHGLADSPFETVPHPDEFQIVRARLAALENLQDEHTKAILKQGKEIAELQHARLFGRK